ncbi:uncharacterized protein BCR38DRAFT_427077 [Pseudomassariella vexata]|uniref:Uncharacterized protein n=1 Tax=Pseudomassariella vexata TaxID=1141098 RepID=A0A1Y2E7B1_9PEZI|nr:uncharacterized protein BCR38DRAFT_427077 [Pseudomassariella vexata]ORY67448.1 hypothetical protein BCR38DRAFT_427077 [Pseudomassariella vexata]
MSRPNRAPRSKSFIDVAKEAVDRFRNGGADRSSSRPSPNRRHHNYDDKNYRHQRSRGNSYDYDSDGYSLSEDDSYYPDKTSRSSRSWRHNDRGRSARSADYYSDSDSSYDSVDNKRGGHHRYRSSQRKRAPSVPSQVRSADGKPNWDQAIKAAVTAGVVEGWKSRNDRERKMQRIATAAAGAAAMDLFVSKGPGDRKNKRHVAESTLGGLMLDKMLNGKR